MALLQLARVLVPGKPLRSSLMFLGRVMSLPYEGAPNKQASTLLIYSKLGCKCSLGTNTLAYFASVTKRKSFMALTPVVSSDNEDDDMVKPINVNIDTDVNVVKKPSNRHLSNVTRYRLSKLFFVTYAAEK
jgi:hypothetical protein